MVRALWRLYSLRVALGLSAGLIGGCVELPGIYYDVLLNERPSESDCVNMTDALTAKLNLQLQPSPYQCAVTLDNDRRSPPRNVAIFASFRRGRILVEINELRFGSPTLPSPSTQQFAQQDHSSELFVARTGLRVYPQLTPGVEGTVSLTSYDQTVLNNNTAYSAGVYADWQPGPSLHLQARGGYSIFQFQQTSRSIQTASLNSWYIGLTATHQITESVSYSLSAGHDVRLGILSDAIEEYYFQPSINWNIIRNWAFQTSLSYQHGNQGVANEVGNLIETYDWITGGFGLSHAITSRLTAALNYHFTLRSSNIPLNEYTQNFVELQLTYLPQ